VSDDEAEQKIRDSLVKAHSSALPLQEDKSLSKKLDGLVERMIKTGAVQAVDVDGTGGGWALAFTSLDPTSIPKSALERVDHAQGYGLSVSFRKTKRYPFGAYWTIVFLKGVS
jgi:hypothetical protein